MVLDNFLDHILKFFFEFSNTNALYLILIIMALSALFIKKDDTAKNNAKNIVIPSSIILFLLLLIDFLIRKNVIDYTSNPLYINKNTWLMILVWPVMVISYLYVELNAKRWVRVLTSVVSVVLVILLITYPALLAVKKYQKYDYTLSGTYTMSDSAGSVNAEFEDHILTIGQKGSGDFIEGFDVDLMPSESMDVSLAYRAHIMYVGWYDWSPEETTVTYDRDYGIDTVQFMLYGKDSFSYRIEYRIAAVGEDWQEWQSEGVLVGIEDSDSPIEAIQIRLVTNEETIPNTWTVTQYSDYSSAQSRFYTIRNNEDGSLIVVDGGSGLYSSQVRSVISLLGGRVDYWFITSNYEEFSGAYSGICEVPNGIEIGEVYVLSSFSPDSMDEFELDGLNIKIIDGTILRINGQQDSIMFCCDSYVTQRDELLERYGTSVWTANYIEVEALGENSDGVELIANLNPRCVFIDSPAWMIVPDGYEANALYSWCIENNISVYHRGDAPNRVPFN